MIVEIIVCACSSHPLQWMSVHAMCRTVPQISEANDTHDKLSGGASSSHLFSTLFVSLLNTWMFPFAFHEKQIENHTFKKQPVDRNMRAPLKDGPFINVSEGCQRGACTRYSSL
eukprot:2873231-Amphidinium_carterae.1